MAGAVATAWTLSRKDEILDASPFGALNGAVRAAVAQAAELEELLPGQVLGNEGEAARAVFLIGAGRVRLERARSAAWRPKGGAPVEAGPCFAVAHRGPGEMVGETALVANLASETAVVADAGDALALGVGGLRRLVAGEPRVRETVAAALVAQHHAAQERLEALLLHGVEVRLARLLLGAASRWGVPHEGGELLTASFTHADVAVLIGSTRETVTLLFGKLRRQGLVAFERRRVVIRDRAGLERLAAAAAG